MHRIHETTMSGNKTRHKIDQSWSRTLSVIGSGAFLAWAVGMTSCQSNHPPTEEQRVAPSAVALVAGDVIKLTFPGAPELNQSQKIRTDGKVNLPLIGEVPASGKTVPGLQADLAARYKSELKTSSVV